jgi:hypothetical protein
VQRTTSFPDGISSGLLFLFLKNHGIRACHVSSVAAANEGGCPAVPFKRFFVFPKLRSKNSGENSERKN